MIAWQLYINYQKQNLGKNVVVTDTLAYNGIFDEDSINVFIYNVNPDGTTAKTMTQLDKSNYTVAFGKITVAGQERDTFTLTFINDFEVKDRYVIEFITTVPDVSQNNYTNNATVTVAGKNYPYSATVNYGDYNKFLQKGAIGVKDNKVYTGDEINWEVTVNENLSIIKDANLDDIISKGLVYVEGSLNIYKLEGANEVKLTNEDYNLDLKIDTEKTVLSIEFLKDIENTLILK